MQTALKIERSVVIKADQARVWKALTTPEGLAGWFHKAEFKRLEVGQKIHFSWEPHPSVDYTESDAEIIMVEPIHRFGWRDFIAPPNPTLTTVIFELETVDGGTRVTVTETGFEMLPDGLREKRFNDNIEGWEIVTQQLADYVEGQTS